MTSDTSTRALCSRCMESFEVADLSEHVGERLCVACLMIAERAAARPTEAPAAVPGALLAPVAPVSLAPVAALQIGSPSATMRPEGLVRGFLHDAASWARGRTWFLRLPMLGYLVWIFARHLLDVSYQSWFKALNLGVHELGHYVFRPFGEFLTAAGGTILQCLAPLVGLFLFRKQREVFGMAVAGGWLATNLFDVAVYVGDARAMALPLVTPGGGPAKHDWHYLLGEMGLLHFDGLFEGILRVLACGVMAASIAFGAWLVWIMVRTYNLRDRVEEGLPG